MSKKKPTQAERVHVLWQLLRIERPAPHVCAFYRYNATVRLAKCSDCANGSAPLAQEAEQVVDYDALVAEHRSQEEGADEYTFACICGWQQTLRVDDLQAAYEKPFAPCGHDWRCVECVG